MFLLVGTVLAGAVGLDSLPPEPTDTRLGLEHRLPTVTHMERAAQIKLGEITPDVLVPVGASAGKRNWLKRYYDEDGNIYTRSEVLLIVDSTDCCNEELAWTLTHSILGAECTFSSLLLFAVSEGDGVWLVLLVPPTAFFIAKRNKHMDLMLTQYNQRL